MKTKTATIERSHVYGTSRYQLAVHYRGAVLRWTDKMNHRVFAIVQDGYPDSLDFAKNHARRFGFTHVKITGDWERMTKPKGGKL